MITRRIVLPWVSVICVIAMPFLRLAADEANQKLVDAEWDRLKATGKNPVPVYSKNARVPGVIRVNGKQAEGSRDVVAWTPVGWCHDCTWPLNDGDVYYNVSDAGALVTVAEFALKPGEAVVYRDGAFCRVTDKTASGSIQTVKGRFEESLRGWVADGKYWIGVSVPISAYPSGTPLKQIELRRGESVVARAIGVVPPRDAKGTMRGTLGVTRDGTPLRLAEREFRTLRELDNPSKGTMRLTVEREARLDSLSLHKFDIESIMVLSEVATLRVDGGTVFIPADEKMSIVSTYGWTVGFESPEKTDGVRFSSKVASKLGVVFVIDDRNTDDLSLVIGRKPFGQLVFAE